MDSIKNFILSILDDHPIISGLFMLIVGILWFIYRHGKKESFRMNDYGLGSWREMVGTWGLIVFVIIWGLILIIRNIYL